MTKSRGLFAIAALLFLFQWLAPPPVDAQSVGLSPQNLTRELSVLRERAGDTLRRSGKGRAAVKDGRNLRQSPALDIQGPRVSIVRPSHGSLIGTATPLVAVSFAGLDSGVDPSSLKVFINGNDLTSEFTVMGTEARFQIGPNRALPEGVNIIRVVVRDRSGRSTSALSAFTVASRGETRFPEKSPVELSFTQPLPSTYFGAAPFPEALTLSRELTQFGYDLFNEPSSTFAPVTDVPVGGDYVIGPGDTLILQVWGTSEVNAVLPVDRRGQIFLPEMEPVQVWGQSLVQVKRGIKSVLSKYLESVQFSVSLGELRTIRVFIVGEVVKAGTYTVSSLATAINALMAATGPTKKGSLRNIKVMRRGRIVRTIDLYAYLLRGDGSQDFSLRSGDTIFVPPVGPVAAISGSVRRPGIYELNGPTRLADLIQMAGGLTPTAYLQRVQVERIVAHQRRSILDVDFSKYVDQRDPDKHVDQRDPEMNIELQDGDFAMIFSIPTRVPVHVSLEGFVKHPGRYELKKGMRLSNILTPDQLLPEAHLGHIEIARVTQNFSTEILSVNARKLLQGDTSQDPVLHRFDRIIISSEVRQPESVTIEGEVKRPGVYTIERGEWLSSVLKRAGGFTDRAFLQGAIFTRESARRIESTQLDKFIRNQEHRLLEEASTLVVTGVEKEELGVQQGLLARRRELLQALAEKVTLGRMVLHLDELQRFEGSESDIHLEDGDTLVVPSRPSSVFVLGSVRAPTSIIHKPGEGVEYYQRQAGGLTRGADEDEIHILKADGSVVSGFAKLRPVEPGDTIVIPAKAPVTVRPVSIFRDIVTILSQTALTLAALSVLFL